MQLDEIITGDNIEILKGFPNDSVDLIVTSPPYNNWRNKRTQKKREAYWERTNIVYDNHSDKESDVEYEKKQIAILNEMVRVLKPTGTICYNHKDQIFNFQAKSPLTWILKSNALYRQRITWDRGGMQAYNPVRFYRVEEDIYILGKSYNNFKWNKECAKYLSVWKISPSRNIYNHNATFPSELVERCIEAFTEKGDLVFDPYNGIGTTSLAAQKMERRFIGIDISENYCNVARERHKEPYQVSLFR